MTSISTTPTHESQGILELTSPPTASPYYGPDTAPTTLADRKWGFKDMAALWISMSACIPTYMLASGLIDQGMNWWQAVLTIFIANVIVLIPMVLNAHAGTRYGIPFPVYCRPSFGIVGANFPALLRALVACGWFGIQAWIGGAALFQIAVAFFPALKPELHTQFLGATLGQYAAFFLFWLINMAVIYKGIDSIRILLNIKAPLLIALGLILLYWAYDRAGGFGPMLSTPSAFDPGQPRAGQFLSAFVPALTAMVGFWATLSLNIPDFSRYAKSQRDQVLGQALGLPTTMALYSFIGVAVTSATVVIYHETIWDPIALLGRFTSKPAIVFSMLAVALATLATNIAANVVSPANDFAHLYPKKITFRVGGLITGVVGVLIMPWKLIADPTGYIFTWLIAYSSLLGAVGGILIVDYFVLRRTKLDLPSLYEPLGPYWYTSGVNWRAIIAFFLGTLPCLPGFLATVSPNLIAPHIPTGWVELYHYAWFISLAIAAIAYLAMMLGAAPTRHRAT